MATVMRGHARPELAPPSVCPKFDNCNAPICPLDPGFMERTHLEGEPACLYLRERAKHASEAIFSASVPKEVAAAVRWAFPLVLARHGHLRRQLERAARTPSKIGAFDTGGAS